MTTQSETITLGVYIERLRAQGVPREHLAFRCFVCGTLQSYRSFERAGVDEKTRELQVGFSCIGRPTGAGPWNPNDRERRGIPGCDWTLGGLFSHAPLYVVDPGGQRVRSFSVATPEGAQALFARDGALEPGTGRDV